MRRILIAIPVKGGLSPNLVKALTTIVSADLPDTKVDFTFCAGTSVALARDEMAWIAITGGYDTLFFWDKDLGCEKSMDTLSMFWRIAQHKEPVVAAQYCYHAIPSAFHGSKNGPEAIVRDDGLLQMHQMPIGFCKIEVEAFKEMIRQKPELAYRHRELGCKAEARHQFFPTGLIGSGTSDGKLERIKAICDTAKVESEAFSAIVDVVRDNDYSGNTMYGEDYFFCKLCRDCSIPMFVDTYVVVPHETSLRLPLTAEQLKDELNASWRQPQANLNPWPKEFLDEGIKADHCADVLEGSYDIPYNPEKPPTILDLGANIGAFTKWAIKRWPGATIHCYEPHAGNYRLLCKTVASLGEQNIVTNNQAVLDRDGEGDLSLIGFNRGEFSLCFDRNNPNQLQKVAITHAKHLPKADILKIDTEGAELIILSALQAEGRLGEFKAIMLEYHNNSYPAYFECMLGDAGFVLQAHAKHLESRGEMKWMRKA